MKYILLTVCLLINSISSASPVEDFYRNTGKIYVVVTVIAVVFIGIIVYLIRLDRKVSKIEKESLNE